MTSEIKRQFKKNDGAFRRTSPYFLMSANIRIDYDLIVNLMNATPQEHQIRWRKALERQDILDLRDEIGFCLAKK